MMVWMDVLSSNISSISYCDQTLFVQFKRGAVYRYFGVPAKQFEGLRAADSVGQYFCREIKGIYECERLTA